MSKNRRNFLLSVILLLMISLTISSNSAWASWTAFYSDVRDVLESRIIKSSTEKTGEQNAGETEGDRDAESAAESQGKGLAINAGKSSENSYVQETTDSAAAVNKIDYDLSEMSVVMSYAEITHMIAGPETYIGKTVKISGSYYWLEANASAVQHYCSMYDGCCTYCDVRFVLRNPTPDPSGYIPEGQRITVTGVFGIIEEQSRPVYGLLDAKLN